MIRKGLFVLIILTLFVSCKNENKSVGKEEVVLKEGLTEPDFLKKTFVVSLFGVFKKDDNFQILYSEDNQGYKVKNRVSKKIQGQDIQQKIIFTLPKEFYPAKLRFDVGSNREQGVILIDSVKIAHEDSVLMIYNNEFRSYFKPNLWVKKEGVENNGRYKLQVKDVKTSETKTMSYDPYFTSTAKLNNALELL